MILIYTDSQIIDLEWLPKMKFKSEYHVLHDLDIFESQSADHKIAFTTHRLHCDLDSAKIGFEDKINRLSKISDLVFTFESELHAYHWTIWEQCHHDNVYWVVPGAVNDRDNINSHIIFWGDWFKTTIEIYRQLPHKLAEICPFDIKPQYFDALLGSPKPHRDFVFESVNRWNLNNHVIMTYGGDWKDNEFYAKDYFIWEPDTVPVGQIIGTADWAEYHGMCVHLSQIIPIDVFNRTAYSIVTETDHDNTLSFFSEKTAKPIIARRLFVAFSGYKFLHNLKTLGFKTFDCVIDESYDQEIDDQKRYSMAFDQVKKLCNMPQQQVYESIRDVVEHNHQLLMTRDWTQWPATKIEAVINSVIG